MQPGQRWRQWHWLLRGQLLYWSACHKGTKIVQAVGQVIYVWCCSLVIVCWLRFSCYCMFVTDHAVVRLVAWLSDSMLVLINEVNLLRVQLVLGWAMVFGHANHLGV